jgi:hypothetical protein
MTDTNASKAGVAAQAMILPLAVAQFIASYAAANMNVPRKPIETAATLSTEPTTSQPRP